MKPVDSHSGDDRESKPRRKWRRALFLLALILAGALTWGAIDLYGPRTSHLRDFDADEVARLETAMWRSYYNKQELRLFNQLAELLRSQYSMPLIRSIRDTKAEAGGVSEEDWTKIDELLRGSWRSLSAAVTF